MDRDAATYLSKVGSFCLMNDVVEPATVLIPYSCWIPLDKSKEYIIRQLEDYRRQLTSTLSPSGEEKQQYSVDNVLDMKGGHNIVLLIKVPICPQKL